MLYMPVRACSGVAASLRCAVQLKTALIWALMNAAPCRGCHRRAASDSSEVQQLGKLYIFKGSSVRAAPTVQINIAEASRNTTRLFSTRAMCVAGGAHRGEVGELGEVIVLGQARLAVLAVRQQPVLAQLLCDAVLQAGRCRDRETAHMHITCRSEA